MHYSYIVHIVLSYNVFELSLKLKFVNIEKILFLFNFKHTCRLKYFLIILYWIKK